MTIQEARTQLQAAMDARRAAANAALLNQEGHVDSEALRAAELRVATACAAVAEATDTLTEWGRVAVEAGHCADWLRSMVHDPRWTQAAGYVARIHAAGCTPDMCRQRDAFFASLV